MALRTGRLPARRNRKPDQGTARHGDRPHQLQPLLGQPVPRAADRRGLCADAGTAPVCCWHQLRKGAGLDTAGTLPETGCTGDDLGTPHGCAPAAIVSVSGDLPAHGDGTGGVDWVERASLPKEFPFLPDPTEYKGKLRPKIIADLTVCACKACRHVPHTNFTLPSSSSAILCRAKSSLAGRSRIMQAKGARRSEFPMFPSQLSITCPGINTLQRYLSAKTVVLSNRCSCRLLSFGVCTGMKIGVSIGVP